MVLSVFWCSISGLRRRRVGRSAGVDEGNIAHREHAIAPCIHLRRQRFVCVCFDVGCYLQHSTGARGGVLARLAPRTAGETIPGTERSQAACIATERPREGGNEGREEGEHLPAHSRLSRPGSVIKCRASRCHRVIARRRSPTPARSRRAPRQHCVARRGKVHLTIFFVAAMPRERAHRLGTRRRPLRVRARAPY